MIKQFTKPMELVGIERGTIYIFSDTQPMRCMHCGNGASLMLHWVEVAMEKNHGGFFAMEDAINYAHWLKRHREKEDR